LCKCSRYHTPLHSFPTRRSSDLQSRLERPSHSLSPPSRSHQQRSPNTELTCFRSPDRTERSPLRTRSRWFICCRILENTWPMRRLWLASERKPLERDRKSVV